MNVFKILIGTGILFLVLIIFLANSDIEIMSPKDVELIGLNETELVLGEGDICSTYGNSPHCRSGLICDRNPNFPDADGRCVKPNITGVYNIRD